MRVSSTPQSRSVTLLALHYFACCVDVQATRVESGFLIWVYFAVNVVPGCVSRKKEEEKKTKQTLLTIPAELATLLVSANQKRAGISKMALSLSVPDGDNFAFI